MFTNVKGATLPRRVVRAAGRACLVAALAAAVPASAGAARSTTLVAQQRVQRLDRAEMERASREIDALHRRRAEARRAARAPADRHVPRRAAVHATAADTAFEAPLGIGQSVRLPSAARALAAGDFDGDHRGDLAAATRADGIRVGLGTATGGFAFSEVDGAAASALAACDVDGDGRLDLVALLPGTLPPAVAWFRGRGDGGFDPPVVRLAGAAPSDLACGDLDGDGRPDLVVAGDSALVVITSRAAPLDSTARYPRHGAAAVALADLDRDGDLDVALARASGGVEVRFNAGGGVLADSAIHYAAPQASDAAAADLDGDGYPDLALFGRWGILSVLRSDGAGGFGARDDHAMRGASYPGALAAADLDGDGRSDVAAATCDELADDAWAQLFVQEPGGALDGRLAYFVAAGRAERGALALADVDGDARPELLVALLPPGPDSLDGVVVVARHRSGLAFSGMADLPLPGGSPRVQVVHFAPGVPELLVDTGEGAYRMRARPDGIPLPPDSFPVGAGAEAVDLDGDGRSDLVAGDSAGVHVRWCGPDGTHGPPVLVPGVAPVAHGDFDGDSLLDLLVRGGDDTLAVARQDGAGGFEAPRSIHLAAPALPLAAADLDGDGRSDLVVGVAFAPPPWEGMAPDPPDSVRVFRCDSLDGFTALGTHALAACDLENCSPRLDRVACADVDGDGALDVVALSVVPWERGIVSVLRNAGNDALEAAAAVHTPREDPVLLAGDWNGDGLADLAAAATGDEGLGRLWLARSEAGAFGAGGVVRAPRYPRSLAAGDLDGDGRVDLVIGYRGFGGPPGVAVVFNAAFDSATVSVPDAPPVVAAPSVDRLLRLHGVAPNPTRGELTVRLAAPGAGPASLELIDLSGRRLHRQAVPARAGVHAVPLAAARGLRPGVYWLRLAQDGRSAAAKVVVAR